LEQNSEEHLFIRPALAPTQETGHIDGNKIDRAYYQVKAARELTERLRIRPITDQDDSEASRSASHTMGISGVYETLAFLYVLFTPSPVPASVILVVLLGAFPGCRAHSRSRR